MNIGSVELENNIFLAPMAGITDKPFRRICRSFGAGQPIFISIISGWNFMTLDTISAISSGSEPNICIAHGASPLISISAAVFLSL